MLGALEINYVALLIYWTFNGQLVYWTRSWPNMAMSSSTSRDPFELDRLAEELASRELANPLDDDDAPAHDLPIYIPLSHTNPYLTSDVFDVEAFLLSRSHTSLRDLRSELRDYLSTLKEELVKLINDDYEAFISLSTDLRGEGARLSRLKLPLVELKSQISVCVFIRVAGIV